VIDVAAGDNFSIVCTEGGEVWTWGEGSGGKLGHGDQKEQREPMLVAGIFNVSFSDLLYPLYMHIYVISHKQCHPGLKGKHIVQVAAGEKHSVALSKDGQVYSWGSNSNAYVQ
jgi:alpha-tubulin suppressor-like RCC1 family protein